MKRIRIKMGLIWTSKLDQRRDSDLTKASPDGAKGTINEDVYTDLKFRHDARAGTSTCTLVAREFYACLFWS